MRRAWPQWQFFSKARVHSISPILSAPWHERCCSAPVKVLSYVKLIDGIAASKRLLIAISSANIGNFVPPPAPITASRDRSPANRPAVVQPSGTRSPRATRSENITVTWRRSPVLRFSF